MDDLLLTIAKVGIFGGIGLLGALLVWVKLKEKRGTEFRRVFNVPDKIYDEVEEQKARGVVSAVIEAEETWISNLESFIESVSNLNTRAEVDINNRRELLNLLDAWSARVETHKKLGRVLHEGRNKFTLPWFSKQETK